MTTRPTRRAPALALAFALALTAAGCGSEAPARPLNVLIVTLDTLRADRMGAYGYGRETTPRLDAFAAESVLFERAFATSSFTPPTHGSILTGLYPAEHGLMHWNKHLADVPTAAELFAAAGYRTGAFTPMPTLLKLGLDRGFQEQQSPPHATVGQQVVLADADAINAVALPWLTAGGAAADQPFFAWVHYYDAHRPFARQGPEWSGMFTEHDDPTVGATEEWYQVDAAERARLGLDAGKAALMADHYDGGLRYLDERVGHLLDGLSQTGVLDDTLVLMIADHGEVFDEHEPEWFTHDPYLMDENVHIPFLLRFPDGRHAGRRVPHLVSQVDVLPTLLALAGLTSPAPLSGLDLRPTFDGGRLPRELVFADRIGDDLSRRKEGVPHGEAAVKASRDRQRMVRSADRKLLLYEDRDATAFLVVGGAESEQVDHGELEPAARKAALDAYVHWRSTLRLPGAAEGGGGLTAEDERFLRSIGY